MQTAFLLLQRELQRSYNQWLLQQLVPAFGRLVRVRERGDIGGRALQERDDYGWTVTTTGLFRSSSRFVCTMKWDGKRKRFEAFQAGRDRYRCGVLRQCFWLVKEDGFYFSNDGVQWIKDFPWM
ncbi:UNVERIFIED_CONTAM: hypothetical protein Sangu_1882500 [Sesamum angustifolium]|uniref:S-protein homolog n=1 Tax=Sesamum angustifolium TaxID=2727405 RepID=A0AAW2LWE5_9LAMI